MLTYRKYKKEREKQEMPLQMFLFVRLIGKLSRKLRELGTYLGSQKFYKPTPDS